MSHGVSYQVKITDDVIADAVVACRCAFPMGNNICKSSLHNVLTNIFEPRFADVALTKQETKQTAINFSKNVISELKSRGILFASSTLGLWGLSPGSQPRAVHAQVQPPGGLPGIPPLDPYWIQRIQTLEDEVAELKFYITCHMEQKELEEKDNKVKKGKKK
jgi:hypothetical protein